MVNNKKSAKNKRVSIKKNKENINIVNTIINNILELVK